jgi:hypothetical protein
MYPPQSLRVLDLRGSVAGMDCDEYAGVVGTPRILRFHFPPAFLAALALAPNLEFLGMPVLCESLVPVRVPPCRHGSVARYSKDVAPQVPAAALPAGFSPRLVPAQGACRSWSTVGRCGG